MVGELPDHCSYVEKVIKNTIDKTKYIKQINLVPHTGVSYLYVLFIN